MLETGEYLEGHDQSRRKVRARRQDSNHIRNSTDLSGGKLAAGLGAAVTRHRLILLGVGETQHSYCTVAVHYSL